MLSISTLYFSVTSHGMVGKSGPKSHFPEHFFYNGQICIEGFSQIKKGAKVVMTVLMNDARDLICPVHAVIRK